MEVTFRYELGKDDKPQARELGHSDGRDSVSSGARDNGGERDKGGNGKGKGKGKQMEESNYAKAANKEKLDKQVKERLQTLKSLAAVLPSSAEVQGNSTGWGRGATSISAPVAATVEPVVAEPVAAVAEIADFIADTADAGLDM